MIRSLLNRNTDDSIDFSALNARLNKIESQLTFLKKEAIRAQKTSLLAMELQGFEIAVSKNPNKRILIAGWYGADNFGDELMLKAVLEHLPNDTLTSTGVLLWDNPAYDRLALDARVHAIHYPASTRELDAIVDNFDVVVWGGGAILDDNQFNNDVNNFNTGNLFIRISELMIAREKQVYCLGLSANENISNPTYLSKLKHIIKKAEHFSLRDRKSEALFMSLGMPKDQLVSCEDLAFSIDTINSAKKETDPEYLNLGLSFYHTDYLLETYSHLVRQVVDAVKTSSIDKKLRIVLIPFLNEKGLDERLNEELSLQLNQAFPDLSVLNPKYNPSLELSPIYECDALISYKYHAALIACSAGIPCLMVSRSEHPHYANKMGHLAELAGVPEAAVSSIEFESNVSEHVKKLLTTTQRPVISQTVYADMDAYMTKICSEIAQ